MKNSIIMVRDNLEEISDLAIEKFFQVYTKKNGHMKVAFSGGKTPKLFFQKLAEHDKIIWDNIDIFLVDERYVELNSLDSNFNLLTHSLLNHIKIPIGKVHYIPYKDTIKESLDYFKNDLIKTFSIKNTEFPVFDFILLGLGNDGHTASLFPETFDPESSEIAISVEGLERVPYDRTSLSMKTINNAEEILFLISGHDKRQIVNEVVLKRLKQYPASHVSAKNETFVLLDRGAGTEL